MQNLQEGHKDLEFVVGISQSLLILSSLSNS